MTEYEVYGAFMGRLYALGSEGDGFYPFLTSGAVSEGALYPTNRALEEGDAIVMDMGPIIEGYNGDCMRTGFVGEPTAEFKELYRVNYESMYAGIETIRPGIRISEVDAAVRRTALGYGYMENRFDTGHGIGLNCCELPVCMKAGTASPRCRARAGHVLHARAPLPQDARRRHVHPGGSGGDRHGLRRRGRGAHHDAVPRGLPGGDSLSEEER